MRFTCLPVELDFITGARYRFESTADLDAPPDQVFDIFADGESWPRWFAGISRVEWTSPEPKGVGTTRTVTLGSATMFEHFLAWERGRRFTFRFEAMTRPMFRAGIEDYRLEDLGGGRTRFHYGVYLEPSLLVRAFAPFTKPAFARMFGEVPPGLQQYVARPR
jgi:uncharacterized protein YndB with AHSA1/START domain